jgi:hypothetical protein
VNAQGGLQSAAAATLALDDLGLTVGDGAASTFTGDITLTDGATLTLDGANLSGVDVASVAGGDAVTLAGIALTGADAANYSIAATATNTADITAKTFCRINPTSTFSGTDCTVVKLSDQSGGCPVGLQTVTYTMGTTETNKNSALAGVSVPACMGIEHSCFPDNVAQYFKTNNLFSKIPSDPKKWVYSCSGYQQYYVANDRSDTSMVTEYV